MTFVGSLVAIRSENVTSTGFLISGRLVSWIAQILVRGGRSTVAELAIWRFVFGDELISPEPGKLTGQDAELH